MNIFELNDSSVDQVDKEYLLGSPIFSVRNFYKYPEKVHQLADSLKEMSDGVKPCEKCHNLTEDIVCSICNSTGRDSQTI